MNGDCAVTGVSGTNGKLYVRLVTNQTITKGDLNPNAGENFEVSTCEKINPEDLHAISFSLK